MVEPAPVDGPDGRLQRWFEAHGCSVELVVIREADAVAAEVLRRQIEPVKADLVVTGLFGRSRLRETVLGGVSRSLPGDPPAALLVSH